jgi:hypothetical protein
MLFNQNSIARVNLLSTHYNYAISTKFHSSYLIIFVGWLYFNLNIHSCNTCGKSQKNTSCKSLHTYLSKYLRGLNFRFMLSFCANSNSFVFNQLSISTFVGFHGIKIPFYILILFNVFSPDLTFFSQFFNRSHSLNPFLFQPAIEPFVGYLNS